MEAFADVADLESRWRDLSESEEERAAVLLGDASAVLSSLVDVDGSEEQAEVLRIVCCNMVMRVMSADVTNGSATFGVSQQSITAGPYTQSFSYSNPTGDFYLTRVEKQMLGIGSSYIGELRPKIGW